MKIVISALLSTILCTSLLVANTVEEEKLDSDMRSMLSAVADIQRAGFYSNEVGLKDAVKKLTSNLDSLMENDANRYLSSKHIDANKFAQKRVKMIKMYALDVLESFESNNYDDAMESYSQILRQCTSCHSRIRSK